MHQGPGRWCPQDHRAIDATLEPKDDWQDAQASLYQQLGRQLKALWASNGTPEMPLEGPRMAAGGSDASKTTTTPVHHCQQHQTEYRRFEKDGRVWYSHKAGDGKWCREK